MTWSTAKEAVRLAVALAVKQPDYAGAGGADCQLVRWQGQPEHNGWVRRGGPIVELEMQSVVGHMIDETRWEEIDEAVPAGSDAALRYLKPHYTGIRHFSVRIRVDIDDQTDSADAVGYQCGLLRTRLKRADVLQILRDANVAIINIGATQNADQIDLDGRQLSMSFTDVLFGTTEVDTDEVNSGDWIATAQGQGELAGDVGDDEVDTTWDTAT